MKTPVKKILAFFIIIFTMMLFSCASSASKLVDGEHTLANNANVAWKISEDVDVLNIRGIDKATLYCGWGEKLSWETAEYSMIRITGAVSAISDSVFRQSQATSLIIAADSLRAIGNSAFQGSMLQTADLHQTSLEEIEFSAFSLCANLESIHLPETVREIQENAFYGCESLSTVYFYGDRAAFDSIHIQQGNETLLNATVICVANEMSRLDYNGDVYYGITGDDTLHITGTGPAVGGSAGSALGWRYINNAEINAVHVSGDITYISPYGFSGMEAEVIRIASPLIEIGMGLFASSTVRTVDLSQSLLTEIPMDCFSGCRQLKELYLPLTIKAIASGAFDGCDQLQYIIFAGSQDEWEAIQFANDAPTFEEVTVVYLSPEDDK